MTGAYKNISRGGGFCFQALLVFTVPVWMELTNKLIKRKKLYWFMYSRQNHPYWNKSGEQLTVWSSLPKLLMVRASNWKLEGHGFHFWLSTEQFVMYTAELNTYFRLIAWFIFQTCIIFPFVCCYCLFTCFKTLIFSSGIPINSFWFSGVSREIENYLLLLLNTTKKKKDYVVLCDI